MSTPMTDVAKSTESGAIRLTPGKRSGQACIRDLRITVADVLDYLAAGQTVEDVLADFPELTREDIKAVLAFAAKMQRGVVVLT